MQPVIPVKLMMDKLSLYSGTISLSEDPLTYQKKIRDEWLIKIQKLHQSFGKLNTKEPTSETVINMRKAERF